MTEPITYGAANEFCDTGCPFFRGIAPCDAHCARDDKPIHFYDWYLAHCKGQMDEAGTDTSQGEA